MRREKEDGGEQWVWIDVEKSGKWTSGPESMDDQWEECCEVCGEVDQNGSKKQDW